MGRAQNLGLGVPRRAPSSASSFRPWSTSRLTSIWVLPVIAAGTMVRVAYLVASAGLHLGLSYVFYFHHAWNLPVIDGGPLGFLTWTIPLLVGSLAYDAMVPKPRGLQPGPEASWRWSVVLMGLGYLLTCLGGDPPRRRSSSPPRPRRRRSGR